MDVQKRKRKKINNNKNTFFQEYNFELLVLGLFGLGFFLLWEDWDIRKNAWIFITSTAQFFVTLLRDLSYNIGKIFKKYGKPSDIIGIVLILIAMILVLNRARIRIIRNHPDILVCPKCDSSLYRAHREVKHKIQSFFLNCKIKRYKCRKCSFEGVTMTGGEKKNRNF